MARNGTPVLSLSQQNKKMQTGKIKLSKRIHPNCILLDPVGKKINLRWENVYRKAELESP